MFLVMDKSKTEGVLPEILIWSIFYVIPFAFLCFLCYNNFGFKANLVSVNLDTGFAEPSLFYPRLAAEIFS